MTANVLLKSAVAARKCARYIFRRRGIITQGSITVHIKTLDVSQQGFGVMATEPVEVGKRCSLIINGVIGEHVVQQTFLCETVYCILAGVDGFRIGLHIEDASATAQKPQLLKIIANCSPSFV